METIIAVVSKPMLGVRILLLGGKNTSAIGGKQTAKNKKGPGKQPDSKSKATLTKATKSNSEGTKKSYPPMSEAQKRAIENLIRRKGVADSEIKNYTGGGVIEDLTSDQASDLIRNLQQNT